MTNLNVKLTEQEVKQLLHIVIQYQPQKCELDGDGWSQVQADLWNKLNEVLGNQRITQKIVKGI